MCFTALKKQVTPAWAVRLALQLRKVKADHKQQSEDFRSGRPQWLVLHQVSSRADMLPRAKLCRVLPWVQVYVYDKVRQCACSACPQ